MTGAARLTVGFGLLAATWVVVYWLTPAPEHTEWSSSALAAVSSGELMAGEVHVGEVHDGVQVGADEGAGESHTEDPALSMIDPMLLGGIDALVDEDSAPEVLGEVLGRESGGEESGAGTGIESGTGAVVPPSFTWHVVEEGENAWSLSERFFGERAWAGAIMRMNPDVDFYRLRVGNEIKVPIDPRNVQGVAVDGGELPSDGGIEQTTYAVRRGDTLGQIASRVYGTSRLWTLIRDANPDINDAGTNIRPGQVLIVPLPPAQR